MDNLTFRRTKFDDVKSVMQIYDDGRDFMIENGNPTQWENGYPSEDLIRDDIEKGQSYVCEFDGEIIAVFMFIIGDDESYQKIHNGSWLNNEPHGVIHRIAVSKNMHDKGIAKCCFDFCKNECLKNNIRNIKIDTYKDNIPMQKALAKYGFSKCGTVYIWDVLERIGYQYVIETSI